LGESFSEADLTRRRFFKLSEKMTSKTSNKPAAGENLLEYLMVAGAVQP
jgi:hypothetical protein